MVKYLIATALLCSSLICQAAGLGKYTVNSHLGEPLNVTLPLVNYDADNAEQLNISIAPQDIYKEMDIELTRLHTSLKFTIHDQGPKPYITISTQKPVHEPYLHFVVRVVSPSGTLYRDITVLLDTPGQLP